MFNQDSTMNLQELREIAERAEDETQPSDYIDGGTYPEAAWNFLQTFNAQTVLRLIEMAEEAATDV